MRPGDRWLIAAKWTARIISLAVLVFGLPFYFGYGNPLPFAKSSYTTWDNIWLSIFPLMFMGLALGWKYEKVGGWLVTASLVPGLLLGLVIHGELIVHMLVPLLAGVLYLVAAYSGGEKGVKGSS